MVMERLRGEEMLAQVQGALWGFLSISIWRRGRKGKNGGGRDGRIFCDKRERIGEMQRNICYMGLEAEEREERIPTEK